LDILKDDSMVDAVMRDAAPGCRGGGVGGGSGNVFDHGAAAAAAAADEGRLSFTFLRAYHHNAKLAGVEQPEFEMERVELEWKAECVRLVEELSKSDLLGRLLAAENSTCTDSTFASRLTKTCIGGYQKYVVS
jgi:hypothetical protein